MIYPAGRVGRPGTPLVVDDLTVNPLLNGCPAPRHPKVVRFARLERGHPLVGRLCLGCDQRFRAGDPGLLIPIGPGGDPQARQAAARGEPYSGRALPLHVACAAGSL